MRKLYIFILLFLMCDLSLADRETQAKVHAVLGLYNKSCSINNPDIICNCISQELHYIASLGYQAIIETLNEDMKKIVNDCAITTGFNKKTTALMIYSCYTGISVDLISDLDLDYDVDRLKARFPSKIEACSCLDREVNARGGEYVFQSSLEAYKKYKEQSQCRNSGGGNACYKIRDTSFDDIYKKCNIIP
ncbi:MAG: hypothetical protein ABW098_06365 [Candidatus Thiodiazotropha sp.]